MKELRRKVKIYKEKQLKGREKAHEGKKEK